MYRCAVRCILHRSLPYPHSSPSPFLRLSNFTHPSFSRAPAIRFSHSRCEAVPVAAAMDLSSTEEAMKKLGLAKTFWSGCRREAYASLYHPFVVSLAAGTLPKQAFQRYMAQDAWFLKAFKNGYQKAMESTEDDDAKVTLDSLMKAAQEELTLHSSVMQSLDATEQESFEPNVATVAYCDFLHLAAAGKDDPKIKSAKIIAAMTPCMRLYAFLGQEVQKNIKQIPDNHPYQDWIDTYSATEFEAAASKVEQLLDKLTESLTGDKERLVLYNLYRQAMNLEVDFFTAQSLGALHLPYFKWKEAAAPVENRRLLLVSDFDSTCTISDSCPVLADLTVQMAAAKAARDSSGASLLLRKKWDDLVMRYMDEYEELLSRCLSNLDHAGGGGKAPTAEELQELLKEMSEFEQKANARVEEAEVLKGLSPASIREAGNAMPLREGCSHFFKHLGSEAFHVDTHILSVCWSKTFIEAVLQQGKIEISNITANELEFSDEGTSTGKMIRNVETALDKLRHLVHILDEQQKQQVRTSVYIGDSLTDLLCLLRADVGIVLGDSSTLKQVYGKKMVPLFRKALNVVDDELQGCVFTVSSWYELEAFLLGHGKAAVLQ